MGRPRKYANDAEKQKAFRERCATINVRTEKDTKDTIARLAEFTDTSEAEVVNSLIKFALLNRNWFTVGLFGKRLPHANPVDIEG
jgi:hypothetical protein